MLSSLYRTPKSHHRATSPGRQTNISSIPSSMNSAFQVSTYHIDVRNVALRSFRDKVILPLFARLYARLSLPNRQDNYQDTSSYQQPRLQQMYDTFILSLKYHSSKVRYQAPCPDFTKAITSHDVFTDDSGTTTHPRRGRRCRLIACCAQSKVSFRCADTSFEAWATKSTLASSELSLWGPTPRPKRADRS